MPTITISAQQECKQDDSSERVVLDIYVRPEDWEGSFDAIEIWRSESTDYGPYSELTGPTWAAAMIPPTAGAPAAITGRSVNLVGRALQTKVNERTDLVAVFSGTDPLTFAQAAAQVQSQSQGLLRAYVDASGTFVLQTVEPGTGAVLRVVGGDAAPLLGLPTQEPDNLVYGHDARLPLVHGQQVYTFVDLQGSDTNFYKTRFRNTQTDSLSDFSAPFSVKVPIGVTPSKMIRGVVDLVDVAGLPLANRQVLIHSAYKGEFIDGNNFAGGSMGKLTDARGHVEFMLLRGVSVTVAIHGTGLVRDVTVPTDQSLAAFNLLDPAIGTDDVFVVQVPKVNFAARRSL
jgi:hypothetical protein